MLDFPATGEALWALYDRTGIRPEYVLPVLYHESGFDPTIENSLGYVGIVQAGSEILSGYGYSADEVRSWPASEQIARIVTPMLESDAYHMGGIASGARVYQAVFLPATLPTATMLQSVLASRADDPHGWYRWNTSLDLNRDGFITVEDLARLVDVEAGKAAVVDAIAQTYALRPGESPKKDPGYGDDFPTPSFWKPLGLVVGIVAGAGAAALWLLRPVHRVLRPRAERA